MRTHRDAPAWRRYLRFWGSNVESDVDDELRFHLEMRIEEYVARGFTLEEARCRAESRFGDHLRARDECLTIGEVAARAQSRVWFIDSLGQDLRFGVRVLRRQWSTAVLAAACLAIGIGAATTMFSVANTLLLRPLPFGNGDRLFTLATARRDERDVNVTSYPDFLDWRTRQHSFTEIAALGQTSFAVTLARPVRASAALVSANFFQTLGVLPIRGRLFADGEDAVDAAPVAIVSQGFAARELGGADRAVGRRIDVRGQPRTIVGVVDGERALPSGGELWLPVPRDLHDSRTDRNMSVIGLLRPGVTTEHARSELASIEAELAREYPEADAELSTHIMALRERLVGPAERPLAAMIAAAVLVLLVACANVAGIQLARATTRVGEISVRAAIGASRGRVVRQLLTESILLSVAGGAAGVFIAYQTSALAGRAILGLSPVWLQPTVDPWGLAFAVIISTLAGVLFGVAPALRLSRADPADVLRGGRSAVSLHRAHLQQSCVGLQIALSIVLLVGAGLSIESVRRLQRVPLGFDPRSVLVFSVTMQGTPYDDSPESRGRVTALLLDRIARMHGVRAVGATSLPPLRCCSQWQLRIDGLPVTADKLMVTGNSVTPGYFEAMGIPTVRGRGFRREDDERAPAVMVINETFASRYFPSGNALGQRIQDGGDHAIVVGVVGDVKQAGVLDAPEPQFYRPFAQKRNTTLTFAVRSDRDDPTAIVGPVRRAVAEIDPGLPIFNISTMRQRVDDALLARRTFELLMVTFGVIALALACAGLFAVTSFFVAQRTRELGLRVALGAEPGLLVAFVVRGSAVVTIGGLLLGTIAALVAARWLSHTLYGIDAIEPGVFAAVPLILGITSLVAVYGPARRATRADPMAALRAD